MIIQVDFVTAEELNPYETSPFSIQYRASSMDRRFT